MVDQIGYEAAIAQDKADLKEILKMRFGTISQTIIENINAINDLEKVGRLILIAANADQIDTFVEELEENEGTFKIIGERFNPLANLNKHSKNK